MNRPNRPETGVDGSAPNQEVSLFAAASVFLGNWRLIVSSAIACAALGAVIALSRPRVFVSSASFIPQAETASEQSSLALLTGQLGVNLGSRNPPESPQFYLELLRSRSLLERVARDTFRLSREPGTAATFRGTVADYLRVKETTGNARLDRAARWLRNQAVKVSTRRDIVQIQVSTPTPTLSQLIARKALDYANDFNVRRRQSRATQERDFVQNRMEVARVELARSEEGLKLFLEANRQFENAPGLRFEHDRLQRDVDMRQQIYTAMLRDFERTRVDELRNMPLLTVIDEPNLPVQPEPRRLTFAVVAGFMIGGTIASLVAFSKETRSQPI